MGEIKVFYSSVCENYTGESPGRGSSVAERDSLALAETLVNEMPSLS